MKTNTWMKAGALLVFVSGITAVVAFRTGAFGPAEPATGTVVDSPGVITVDPMIYSTKSGRVIELSPGPDSPGVMKIDTGKQRFIISSSKSMVLPLPVQPDSVKQAPAPAPAPAAKKASRKKATKKSSKENTTIMPGSKSAPVIHHPGN